MERIHSVNPFVKRESHSKRAVITYKILTTITWLASVIVSVYYTFKAPEDGAHARRRIWKQNNHFDTAFRMNPIIASIYWIVIFIWQGLYIAQLFSGVVERVNQACAVGSHFIVNNLFHFAFVMLFVRSYFGWAELMIILNFFNLESLYHRHIGYHWTIHEATVSGPLAWTFVAIFWNGAIMVPDSTTLVARIFGNIFIWSILLYGSVYIVFHKDYTMGFNLSVLSAAIGVSQFFRQVIALQWIFAFTIMAVLFVGTILIAVPHAAGRDFSWRRREAGDAERAPLLANEGNTPSTTA